MKPEFPVSPPKFCLHPAQIIVSNPARCLLTRLGIRLSGDQRYEAVDIGKRVNRKDENSPSLTRETIQRGCFLHARHHGKVSPAAATRWRRAPVATSMGFWRTGYLPQHPCLVHAEPSDLFTLVWIPEAEKGREYEHAGMTIPQPAIGLTGWHIYGT